MKNKYKILLIILTLFLFTGCSATYNVEIYKEKVKVNGKILEKKDKWDEEVTLPPSGFSNTEKTPYDDLKNEKYTYTYRELVNEQLKKDETIKQLEGLSKINNPWQLGLKLKRDYKLSRDDSKSNSLIKIAGPTMCYDKFNVTEDAENNNLTISTSGENKCFSMYPNLDKITVKLKTNHKVVDSTADNVNMHTYTWNLTRENSQNKPLQITLKKNDYVFNYDNRIVKIIGFAIVISISLVIFYKLVIIIYNFKVRRKNKI